MITAKEALAAFKPRSPWHETYLGQIETLIMETTADGETHAYVDHFGKMDIDTQVFVQNALQAHGFALTRGVWGGPDVLVVDWSNPK